MGGEEFALWLPGAGLDETAEVAERVRTVIERTPCFWGGTHVSMTCSAGVAAIPDSTRSVDNLYGLADAALYRAKQAGRNRVERAVSADRVSADR
jgi:diguanylate cyclase (GGDEF)-like protein